jgi:phosphatidylserine/phosphatidylglycerophosphate/cardiolipin synthase-like enzyme
MKIKTLLKAAALIGVIGLVIILSQYKQAEYTGKVVYETTDRIDVYFCPEEDCKGKIVEELNKAGESIHCAIYNVDEQEILDTIKNRDVDKKLVTDKANKKDTGIRTVRNYNTNQLMHNKFCVIDNRTIITGSYNPTKKEANNSNNILIINSNYLAENYEQEFEELWNKEFGTGRKTKNNIVYLNNRRIENYFCPEDDCNKKVIKELENANSSIKFMIFSFTDYEVADELIKKHSQGIKVEGLLEETQDSNYSKYETLKEAGINVRWYEKKYKLHDKVFIIDGSIIITGSYNPTANADRYNDENIIIIEDKNIAEKYLERFKYLSS